jgi:hypothetical protein
MAFYRKTEENYPVCGRENLPFMMYESYTRISGKRE